MDLLNNYNIYFLIFINFFLIQFVKANKGIFGYNAFATYEWIIEPEPEIGSNECVSWEIKRSGKYQEERKIAGKENIDAFGSVTINPECKRGITLSDTSEPIGFPPLQFYSDMEIDLIVLEGTLDIRLEKSDGTDSLSIKTVSDSEFSQTDISEYNFTFFSIPFPKTGDYSVINFSNPNSNKSVKFYMRRARLINISTRTVLDSLKLYGNDWSFNVESTSFENGVIYKLLSPGGCLSIDLKEPMVGPWDSVIFEIKAPSNFLLYSDMEIQTHQFLKTFADENIVFSEDEWTTVEIKYEDIIYDLLYDRLDICNGAFFSNWFKIRNIYFQPKYKFVSPSKNGKPCCTFNQCVCRIQHRKIYKRRNENSSLTKYHNSILPLIINLVILILLLI